MAQSTHTRATLNAKEAAEHIGVSYWTLLQYVREKKVPFIKLGKRYLFREESLDKWLDKQESNWQEDGKMGEL